MSPALKMVRGNVWTHAEFAVEVLKAQLTFL